MSKIAELDESSTYLPPASGEVRTLVSPTGLILVNATAVLLLLEDKSIAELCRALQAHPPIHWPPEHNGPETREWLRTMTASHPDTEEFWSWYILAPVDGQLTVVGIAGYKGPPDEQGCVEIGYSVVDAYQRRGFASEAVRLLIKHAFSHDQVQCVAAETLPQLTPSQAVLLKNGFVPAQGYTDPEVGEVLRFVRGRYLAHSIITSRLG